MRVFKLFGAFFLSIPFYLLWNFLAPIYLPQLPEQYLYIPFFHCAGIFMLLEIVRLMIFPPQGFFSRVNTARMQTFRNGFQKRSEEKNQSAKTTIIDV